MPDFPAHASPAFPPIESPRPQHRDRTVSDLKLHSDDFRNANQPNAPPPLISPAFTPPRTPSAAEGQRHDRQPRGEPVTSAPREGAEDSGAGGGAELLPTLPEVNCEVRARIPTTTGTEMWLHLYHNNVDNKEHLAIVFGPHIRSRSLDRVRPGETERERMIRGAYVGTLYPGRTSSRRVEEIRREEGVGSGGGRPSAGFLAGLNEGKRIPSSGKDESGSGSEAENEVEELTYPANLGPPLVRIHSECYTGETVWSARCDCGEQLDEAARLMSLPAPTPLSTPGTETPTTPNHGGGGATHPQHSCGGVIIYLRQEGRGIGLGEKLKAYNLQDLGHDTMEANLLLRHPGDARSYGLATAMLQDLGLGGGRGIKLLTNNPEKVRAVEGMNREVRVVERVPMIPLAWRSGGKEGVKGAEVERYISTKIEKFKHMFTSG